MRGRLDWKGGRGDFLRSAFDWWRWRAHALRNVWMGTNEFIYGQTFGREHKRGTICTNVYFFVIFRLLSFLRLIFYVIFYWYGGLRRETGQKTKAWDLDRLMRVDRNGRHGKTTKGGAWGAGKQKNRQPSCSSLCSESFSDREVRGKLRKNE